MPNESKREVSRKRPGSNPGACLAAGLGTGSSQKRFAMGEICVHLTPGGWEIVFTLLRLPIPGWSEGLRFRYAVNALEN